MKNETAQPKQRTKKGLEIPVPKRKDFETVLDKVAKAPKRSTTRRPKK